MSRPQLQAALNLSQRVNFAVNYLRPALSAGLIEMTLPDKPRSKNQRYRLTPAGQSLAAQLKGKKIST